MNQSLAPSESAAAYIREENGTWGIFFFLASITLCILMCIVSWVVCANIQSPTGDIVRDAVLAVLRPQERARRRAMVAEVGLAESPESFENSEDEAVLQRDDDDGIRSSNGTPAAPPPPDAEAPSAKALGKRRCVTFAQPPRAQESTFLGPTVYGC